MGSKSGPQILVDSEKCKIGFQDMPDGLILVPVSVPGEMGGYSTRVHEVRPAVSLTSLNLVPIRGVRFRGLMISFPVTFQLHDFVPSLHSEVA